LHIREGAYAALHKVREEIRAKGVRTPFRVAPRSQLSQGRSREGPGLEWQLGLSTLQQTGSDGPTSIPVWAWAGVTVRNARTARRIARIMVRKDTGLDVNK
jgi:hypothetical protein